MFSKGNRERLDDILERPAKQDNVGWQDMKKPLSARRKRMYLFLATYSLAAMVVFFMGSPMQKLGSAPAEPEIPLLLLLIAGTFAFLPSGVVIPFIAGDSGVPYPLLLLLLGLSYVLTALLPLFGSSTEKPRTFRRLYFLFVVLVIINVAGCLSNPVPIP